MQHKQSRNPCMLPHTSGNIHALKAFRILQHRLYKLQRRACKLRRGRPILLPQTSHTGRTSLRSRDKVRCIFAGSHRSERCSG